MKHYSEKKKDAIDCFFLLMCFFFDELTQMVAAAAAVGPVRRRFTLGKAEMPFDFLRLCLRLAL